MRGDRDAPAETPAAEASQQPPAEAGVQPRRRRGRPRNGETNKNGEGDGISDGAAALAAFPD
jgi:hypothetical protein